ncbi:MAG TPA: hypothetical protein VID72_11160, partial [Ktedonobacterales bacterium]
MGGWIPPQPQRTDECQGESRQGVKSLRPEQRNRRSHQRDAAYDYAQQQRGDGEVRERRRAQH